MSAVRSFDTDLRKVRLPGRIPRVRLEDGERFVDIIQDRRGDPPILTCIGQKHGSNEILFLGQFRTLVEAEAAAQEFVRGNDNPMCVRAAIEIGNVAADVNRRLQMTDGLIASSKNLLAGGKTLLRQSREPLHRRD